ncbi:OsmC family protein [Pararhodonellum marinum]|uniref:OsmC family protein n=1 Tax=Pararhodonellum marinum TaxID=2755358 RepID=UPI00188FC356|nr:OsmC family protein [Pararhodonellum marinum]
MPTIKSSYSGNLRTVAEHLASGTTLISDAPVDNNGKGQAFSPTDLVAASLGSCMATIMGILANREGKDLTGLKWEIVKIMQENPRKIKEIVVEFYWDQPFEDLNLLQKLKKAALTCPVALSLDPGIQQTVHFHF